VSQRVERAIPFASTAAKVRTGKRLQLGLCAPHHAGEEGKHNQRKGERDKPNGIPRSPHEVVAFFEAIFLVRFLLVNACRLAMDGECNAHHQGCSSHNIQQNTLRSPRDRCA